MTDYEARYNRLRERFARLRQEQQTLKFTMVCFLKQQHYLNWLTDDGRALIDLPDPTEYLRYIQNRMSSCSIGQELLELLEPVMDEVLDNND